METPPSKRDLQAKVDTQAKRVDKMAEEVADVRNDLQTIQFQVNELRDEEGKESGSKNP